MTIHTLIWTQLQNRAQNSTILEIFSISIFFTPEITLQTAAHFPHKALLLAIMLPRKTKSNKNKMCMMLHSNLDHFSGSDICAKASSAFTFSGIKSKCTDNVKKTDHKLNQWQVCIVMWNDHRRQIT